MLLRSTRCPEIPGVVFQRVAVIPLNCSWEICASSVSFKSVEALRIRLRTCCSSATSLEPELPTPVLSLPVFWTGEGNLPLLGLLQGGLLRELAPSFSWWARTHVRPLSIWEQPLEQADKIVSKVAPVNASLIKMNGDHSSSEKPGLNTIIFQFVVWEGKKLEQTDWKHLDFRKFHCFLCLSQSAVIF